MNVMTTYSYGLDFFSDSFLEDEVAKLISKISKSRKKHNPYKNVIDPFGAVFEAALNNTALEEWFPAEVTRQMNKTLSNAIGDFHQNLLGGLPGWSNLGASGGIVDLVHEGNFGALQKPAIAEVKNKFNTLNAGGKEHIYDGFQDAMRWSYQGHVCYLIEIIPKKQKPDSPWRVANRGLNENIRLISAVEVYALSTGDSKAFKKLFSALNMILSRHYNYDLTPEADSLAGELFNRAFEGIGH